jgi:hypothetical protein
LVRRTALRGGLTVTHENKKMENITLNIDYRSKIRELVESGKRTLIISNYDDKLWKSGFVKYLKDNYQYVNHRSRPLAKVYLTRPI